LGLGLVAVPPRSRFARRAFGLLAVAAAAFGLIVVDLEFFRHAYRDDTHLQSLFERGGTGRWLRPLNIVPEADIVSFHVQVSSLLRYQPREQMAEVHGLLMREYVAMQETPGFAHAGNIAAQALSDGGHFFRYLPQGYSSERRWPLLLFLHGAGGNLALYPWLWRRLADERGVVIVCPTWDNGLWDTSGGTRAALIALENTLQSCAIDPERVFLAGLSNGAITGWAVLSARPEAFRGFISISGGLASGRDPKATAHVPVLLIHGVKDRIVPVDASRRRCAVLRRANVPADLVQFANEDHFLFLRSTEQVTKCVARWMAKTAPVSPVNRMLE
jgi:poly(3-hydroxybutyrate) depolymerase